MQKELRISTPIILASASPRRRTLIDLAFSDVEIIPSNAEENLDSAVDVSCITEELAELKAREVASRRGDKAVIACDTVVIFENKLLGKPKSPEEAFKMLSSLSGNIHTVSTGCCIIYKERCLKFHVESKVKFYDLSEDLIRAYIRTGEPMDKAGAYGIQEKGSLLVDNINGDYFNIVGLPVATLMRKFKEFESLYD